MYCQMGSPQASANYSWNNLKIIGANFTNENNRYIFQKPRIIYVGTVHVVHTSVDVVNYKQHLSSFGGTLNLGITYIRAESANNFSQF